MKRSLPEIRFGWWVLLTLGLMMISVSTGVRILRRRIDLWNRTAETARDLERIVRDTAQQRQTLGESLAGPPAKPATLREGLETPPSWDFGDPVDTVLTDGIRHRVVNVGFGGVSWEELRGFLGRAEGRSPPWRVTSLEIDTTVEGLKGRLRLEALDKPSAAP